VRGSDRTEWVPTFSRKPLTPVSRQAKVNFDLDRVDLGRDATSCYFRSALKRCSVE